MRRETFCLILAAVSLPWLSRLTEERLEVAAAESLTRKIENIRERHRSGTPIEQEFRVSETEINAYLAYRLAPQAPEGVQDLWVRIGDGVVNAGGSLDLASLRGRLPGVWPAFILSGAVPAEVRARIHADDGVGRLDLESVSLAGLPVPTAFLQQLVSLYSRTPSRPGGVRLEEPFALPYGIRSARVVPGEIILRQGALETRAGSR